MREVETRLLPITRCADCTCLIALCFSLTSQHSCKCYLTGRRFTSKEADNGFGPDCPLETKAHNDMVKRREVFLDDQDRQLRKWFDDNKHGDREDRRFAHERIEVWSMVRRCNGME